MRQLESRHPNPALLRTRYRRSLERKQVSWLLGYKGPEVLAKYERGDARPSLQNAIKLSLIYGCDLEEIFPEDYKRARKQIFEKAAARRLISVDRTPQLVRSINRCSFEDALRDENQARLHRDQIRDHITTLAKALAQI